MCKNACARHWVTADPIVREGIVAQSTIRFAAGAGVVAASLLIVGPNPAEAVADKHGSGSHSRNNDRKNGSNGHGRRPKSNVPDLVNGIFDIGEHRRGIELIANDSTPRVMDLVLPAATSETLPSRRASPPRVRQRCGRRPWRRNPRAVTPPARGADPRARVAVTTIGAGRQCPSRSHRGSMRRATVRIRHIGAPARRRIPRVVVGNGRSPGLQDADTEPAARIQSPRSRPRCPWRSRSPSRPCRHHCRRSNAFNRHVWWWSEMGTRRIRHDDRPAVRARRLDSDPRGRRRPRLPAGAGGPVAAGVNPSVGPCAGSFPTTTSGSRR